MSSPLTYIELRNAMAEQFPEPGRNGTRPRSQVLANLATALNVFQRHFSLSNAAPVGHELTVGFRSALQQHLEALHRSGLSHQTLKDRKAGLWRWKRLADCLYRARAQDGEEPTQPFHLALLDLLEKAGPLRTVAREAHVSRASLVRWKAGGVPRKRAIAALRRLEHYLGTVPGTLVDSAFPGASPRPSDTPQIAYRERLRVQRQRPYRLKQVNASLRAAWGQLVTYKTDKAGTLERSGSWRLRPLDECSARMISWASLVSENEVAPTANIAWSHLAAFFGWLKLPSAEGGQNMPDATAQDLAWLTHADIVADYVNWYARRSAGLMHGGIRGFIILVLTLVNPRTGYLTQTPRLGPKAPQWRNSTAWGKACQDVYKLARRLLSMALREDARSRDPFEPIKHILDLPNPMDAVARMIAKMRLARPTPGSIEECIWARDLLLVRLMSRYPLRALNLQNLSLNPSAETRLFKDKDGAWKICIAKKKFKNFAGAAKDRDYAVTVDKALWKDIEVYLGAYRPRLAGAASGFVFVSSDPKHKGKLWSSLNRRVEWLTKRYLEGCPGIGPQGFRHIYATSVLKQFPGEITSVAYALHDREETVRKYYRRFLTVDGIERVDGLLRPTFARM